MNPHIVDVISKSDLIPVIAPIGLGRDGQTLNINADVAASALAARMKASACSCSPTWQACSARTVG